MSDADDTQPMKGFERPADPAGTRPKVDPSLLRAAPISPLVIDSDAEEIAPESEVAEVPAPADDAPVGNASTDLQLTEQGGGLARPLIVAAPHADRFQFLLGGLIALGLSAIAALALLFSQGRAPIPPPWSSWAPGSSDISGVHEIANRVGAEYRAADGGQLVAVSGTPQEIAGVPVQVAVRTSAGARGSIPVFNGTGVIYQLCGLGAKCSISTGQPSSQRHLLLRREALELALYTFRYIGGVDQVEVFMPPRKGQSPSQVLFFRSSQLAAELDRPLRETLTAPTPTVNTIAQAADTALVDRVTTQSLYAFTLASQNGSEFLVLQQF
ncbi:MAG: hypothetical protein NVSMB51_11950 [Solirubrobacteraceae bacterium]